MCEDDGQIIDPGGEVERLDASGRIAKLDVRFTSSTWEDR
jgi:hypothetical protein